ncbi:MAG TPA: CsbD family protein [Cellvibrionaceae bacterium]
MNTPQDPFDPIVSPIQAGNADKSGSAKQSDDKSRTSQQPSQQQPSQQSGQKSGQQQAEHSQKKPQTASSAHSDSKQQATKSPQQQSSATADRLSGKWDQFVGSAKTTWGKLTDDEILQSEGNAQKLAGLVEERYALSRDLAETQVKKFLDNCRTK